MPGSSFPRWGPTGWFPHVASTMRSSDFSVLVPLASLPSLGGTTIGSCRSLLAFASPFARPGLGQRVTRPRSWWKHRDLPGSWVPPCACAVLSDPGEISASRHGETSMLRAAFGTDARSHDFQLSRLNHTAAHSLCTLRSQRRRWTTQHSVPARLLAFHRAGRFLLRHRSRFQVISFASSSTRLSWRTPILVGQVLA